MSVIALTGATGFVGQAVLDEAARRGQAMRALVRRPQAPRDGVSWIEGGLDDGAALARLVDGASAVLHVAGLTSSHEPAAFEVANVTGTANVIAAMRAGGTERLIFVSSLSAREPDLSAYGASKARAEAVVAASGLDWTTVRPPGVYGPRDVDYFEMFRSARLGLVPLPPRGASSIIHVDDLARLLLDLVTAPAALVNARVFEPDDGRVGGWSHGALAQAIGAAVGRRRVFAPHLPRAVMLAGARIDGLVRGSGARLTRDRVGYMAHPDWVVSPTARVPAEVWKPRIAGAEGLAATAVWYREAGLLPKA